MKPTPVRYASFRNDMKKPLDRTKPRCLACGTILGKWADYRQQYCDQACKQSAYRHRQKDPEGRSAVEATQRATNNRVLREAKAEAAERIRQVVDRARSDKRDYEREGLDRRAARLYQQEADPLQDNRIVKALLLGLDSDSIEANNAITVARRLWAGKRRA